MTRTDNLRPPLDPLHDRQLLISDHKPPKPVQPCTIARWIKSILGTAGIDTTIFKGHSIRSVSTTTARAGGVSLEEILRMAS